MLILIDDAFLQICLTWKEKLFSFSGSLRIPLFDIVSIGTQYQAIPTGIRILGSYVPGIITAGNYYTKNGWEFWYVSRKKKILRIELQNQFYSRLILGVDDNLLWKKKLGK